MDKLLQELSDLKKKTSEKPGKRKGCMPGANCMTETGRLQLRARQAQSIMRMTPWTLLLNIVVSIVVFLAGRQHVPSSELYAWSGVNIAASLAILTHWQLTRSRCASEDCTARYIIFVTMQGVLLGVIWAALPLAFFDDLPPDMSTLIMALTIGAFSLGSFRMAQAPMGAAAYIIIPTAGLVTTSLWHMEKPAGYAFAVMSAFYASALILVVYMRQRDAMNNARNAEEVKRQKNIIELLLHDFEDNAEDWLWETDSIGRLTYVSNRLEELAGRPREELRGEQLHKVLGCRRDGGKVKKFITAMLQGRAINGMILPACFRDRNRWLSMTARPLYGSAGALEGYRGVASDVTERYEREQRLRREREKAIQESKAKSNFLAVISHELRTPLNAMVGFSELLVNEAFGPLNEKYREFSTHIHEGSRQLERLINDILDYTRFERNKIKLSMQEVDLGELADMTLRQLRMDERARGLELKLNDPGDVIVSADLGRLKQVLSNLLVNAIKFTKEGSVTVDITRNEDGGVSVSVTDTGIGISPEDMKTIFEPFCQADASLSRRQDGVGLGLSIARSLMKLHGGDLTLSSRPGEGVTATFTLPPERVIGENGEGTLAA